MARDKIFRAGLALTGVLVSLAAWAAPPGDAPQQRVRRDGPGTATTPTPAPTGAREVADDTTDEPAQRAEADRYQPWTTPEGVHMLRVGPAASMHLSVLRCDDGRLVAAERGRAACADH